MLKCSLMICLAKFKPPARTAAKLCMMSKSASTCNGSLTATVSVALSPAAPGALPLLAAPTAGLPAAGCRPLPLCWPSSKPRMYLLQQHLSSFEASASRSSKKDSWRIEAWSSSSEEASLVEVMAPLLMLALDSSRLSHVFRKLPRGPMLGLGPAPPRRIEGEGPPACCCGPEGTGLAGWLSGPGLLRPIDKSLDILLPHRCLLPLRFPSDSFFESASSTPWTGHINATLLVLKKGERKEACVQGIGTPISHA
mmetsp:Transcript_66069/g.166585  ORF Transcript_66069/g.166585 Transcript_66069/m.166585 type:complete len:253 (-) Transcript_66069:1109-1867(-)